MRNGKVTQTIPSPRFDWCVFFKNGKIPSDPIWKGVMAGFGKYIKNYKSCPLKRNLDFDQMRPEQKSLIFIPVITTRLQLIFDCLAENRQKELLNITLTFKVYEEK